jgi:hypothetical protein
MGRQAARKILRGDRYVAASTRHPMDTLRQFLRPVKETAARLHKKLVTGVG